MFPLSKLGELSPRTRLRKIARILQGLEIDLSSSRRPHPGYVLGLLELLEPGASAGVLSAVRDAREAAAFPDVPAALLRALNALRHELLRELHAEPAEWDLVSRDSGLLDRSGLRVYPMRIYLEDIRSPFNVGSIFRTAEAFGAERILLSPRTPRPAHVRARKTAMGADQAVPWEVAELSALRGSEVIFALEVGGTRLQEFPFPSRGIVLVGSEELGLSPDALLLADAGLGRVSIPLAGAKRSLNVSVAFGILMQAWYEAQER